MADEERKSRRKPTKKAPRYTEQREIACEEKITAIRRMLPPLAGDFLRSLETTASPLTRLGYAMDLRVFFRFLAAENPDFADLKPEQIGAENFDKLTLRDLELYQSYLKQYVSDSRLWSVMNKTDRVSDENASETPVLVRNHEAGIARKLCALRAFFRYLYKRDLIRQNVAEKLTVPRQRKKPTIYLEKDEILHLMDTVRRPEGMTQNQQAYLEHTRTRDLAILSLLLGTGIRASELVGLNMTDVSLPRREFVITRKGGNAATLMFNEQVRECLADYLAERERITPAPGHEQALFLSLQRKRLTVRSLEYMVKKYAQIAAPMKQHLSPHKMRSTFGTNLYFASGDIELVAEMLGHASVDTTRKHYVGNSEDQKQRAARLVDWLPAEDRQAEQDDRREDDGPAPAGN